MIRKLLLSVAAFVAVASIAMPASAAMTFNWTDLSNQLTTRTNRPIWAMTYAQGNWFYTDGQDLWNGGQVYRYDGYTQTNITTEVRNAGISRVDDIVSDGQTAMFMQDIAPRSNIAQAVTYNASTGYRNITSNIRNAFFSDENVSSISGKNGTWYVVTSRARLMRVDTFGNVTQISLPSELSSRATSAYSNITESRRYMSNTNGMGWSSSPAMVVVPISGSRWLVTMTGFNWLAYEFDGSNFTSLANSWQNTTNIQWVGSNGETAFILKNVNTGGYNNTLAVHLWNTQYSNTLHHNVNTSGMSLYGGAGTRALWTGTQWMILNQSKYISTLSTSGQFAYVGEARDYFVTGASNNQGTVLLGGAVSTVGNPNPSSPLTAKLTKVTEGTVSTPNNNGSTQTSGNVSAWAWLDPNQSTIRRDQNVTYNVGAWAGNGLSRVEIFVNGVARRTCDFNTAYGNQSCAYAIWGGEYGVGTQVAVNAKATSVNGQTVWTSLSYLNVTDVNGSTNPNPTYPSNSNTNTSIWSWSSPETSTITKDANVTFSTGASDPDGISKIEVLVNGSVSNTCNYGSAYGNRECTVTLNGSSFAVGTDIFVNARVTDVYGNTTWSASRTYRILSGSTVPAANTPSATWIWSTPDVSSLTSGQTATFNIGAWDANGLNRTEIWVNGQLKRTCTFGNVVGNRDCSYAIRANDYQAGTSVFVNARVMDSLGNLTWSSSKTYSISSSTLNNPSTTEPLNNLPGSISVTSNRDGGYKNNQLVTFTATAADQNGIDRIELYVNAVLVKTCYNVATCSFTGGSYNNRNTVSYGATIVDKSGYAIWTGYKTINKI